jgi:hypothetical protein
MIFISLSCVGKDCRATFHWMALHLLLFSLPLVFAHTSLSMVYPLAACKSKYILLQEFVLRISLC